MKAYALVSLMIIHGHAPPPTLTYFDTLSQCTAALDEWESRTRVAYPLSATTRTTVSVDKRGVYPLVIVGYYTSVCLPSWGLDQTQPWVHNSP